jgi:hypothetical protein
MACTLDLVADLARNWAAMPDSRLADAGRAVLHVTDHGIPLPPHRLPDAKACCAPVAAVARVRKVHRISGLGEHCVNCQFAWPCPTIRALDGG